MNIVVLDGYTANPGDLSWQPLRELGTLTVYDRTPDEQVIDRAQGAEAVLTNKTPLDRECIYALKNLKYIGVLATGVNVLDLSAAAERGIVVSNVRDYSTDSVAQMVFAHILNLCHHVAEHSESVHQGKWARSTDFSYWDFPLTELAGLTLGIIGFGAIGSAVARIGQSFGMHVICHTRTPDDEPGVNFVRLDDVFRQADVLSLHCPLTPQTACMVNTERLRSMKRSAFLINTARGGLVDEEALAYALREGEIAGAGIDVMREEPPPSPHPLYQTPNCYITPHNAWATRTSRERLLQKAADNLRAFLNGQPQSTVVPE